MNTKSKVLLAEDDLSLGYVIKDNLADAGYEVVLCADGQAAIDKFSKENFDICLLDVMMPNKDGFAVAKKIRQQTDQIPILADHREIAWKKTVYMASNVAQMIISLSPLACRNCFCESMYFYAEQKKCILKKP